MREWLRLTVPDAVGITGGVLWRRYVEQLTGSRDVSPRARHWRRDRSVEFVETIGQDVGQKAADKLVVGLEPTGLTRGVECHQLIAVVVLGPVIPPFERHARAVEGDEAAVGNSDPVSVAGQVGEHSLGSAKRPLGIDHPFDLSQCGKIGSEGCRFGQAGLIGEELQSPSLVGRP